MYCPLSAIDAAGPLPVGVKGREGFTLGQKAIFIFSYLRYDSRRRNGPEASCLFRGVFPQPVKWRSLSQGFFGFTGRQTRYLRIFARTQRVPNTGSATINTSTPAGNPT